MSGAAAIMLPTCAICSRPSRVLLQHSLRIGSRLVQWRECAQCDAAADERDAEAAKEREAKSLPARTKRAA